MNNFTKLLYLSFSIFLSSLYSCQKDRLPTLATAEVTEITGISAKCGGTITDEGTARISERGVCWSKSSTPTIADKKNSDATGQENFITSLTSLDAATTYYVRAYARNEAGVGYGTLKSFATLGSIPAATVIGASNITGTSATLTGSVNANDLSTDVFIEYGETTNYGQSKTVFGNPVNGNYISIIGAAISGLEPGTVYHFRIKAENSLGNIYSDDMSFTTLGQAPSVLTLSPINLMSASLLLAGSVNANYLASAVSFEFGTTINYGTIVVPAKSNVNGNTDIIVTAPYKGLLPNTTYHFRVKAENSLGITYGNDMTFITQSTLTDLEGNIYSTVTIGDQTWMQENLKSTLLNDGTVIPFLPKLTDWSEGGSVTTPGLYYYSDPRDVDNEILKNTYGILYNWYTVETGKICPVGWHVPSIDEWNILVSFSCKSDDIGGNLMEVRPDLWKDPGVPTNKSGFSARPGGYFTGTFIAVGSQARWYSSEGDNRSMGYATIQYVALLWGHDLQTISKKNGYNIRCLKDK